MDFELVEIDCDAIIDWDSLHSVFSQVLGFPDFYGKNMNAWIDCMTSLDEPADGMTSVHAPKNGCLVLQLTNVKSFATRCLDIYDEIVECSAFVNWRRIETVGSPVLVLSFSE